MEQKPQIPTLKDSKRPQIQIKGLSSTLGLFERLKKFRKKDLAFILAGLGVLFMAPLAEHFLMSPENADSGAFKQGWGFQPTGRFGDGSSPYEGGVGGLAPGGVAGGGTDVITPLNVRDPSALVMGPSGQQQPAATATTTPPATKEGDWKDAIANAATKGASAATKSASLPVPKTALSSILRGLGVVSGSGSGGSYSLPPLSAGNVPNRAAPSNALQPGNAAPGYKGAARGPQNASGASMEALKNAAAQAGNNFGRTGSAGAALESAASQAMPSGGGGFGGGNGDGTTGAGDKAATGNQDKGSKNVGESLEFIAAKDWQQKMRDLAYDMLKKDKEFLPDLQRDMVKELVMGPTKKLAEAAGDWAGDLTKTSTQWTCVDPSGKPGDLNYISYDVSDVGKNCSPAGDPKDNKKTKCLCGRSGRGLGGMDICTMNHPENKIGTNCSKAGGADKPDPDKGPGSEQQVSKVGEDAKDNEDMANIEKSLDQEVTQANSGLDSPTIKTWNTIRISMQTVCKTLRQEVPETEKEISVLLNQAANEVVGQEKVIAKARVALDGAQKLKLTLVSPQPTGTNTDPTGQPGERVNLVPWESWDNPYQAYLGTYNQVSENKYLSQAEEQLKTLDTQLGKVDIALDSASGVKEEKQLKNTKDATNYEKLVGYKDKARKLQKNYQASFEALQKKINEGLATINQDMTALYKQISWVALGACPFEGCPSTMNIPTYNICDAQTKCDPAADKIEKLKQLKTTWTDTLKPVGGYYKDLQDVEKNVNAEVKNIPNVNNALKNSAK